MENLVVAIILALAFAMVTLKILKHHMGIMVASSVLLSLATLRPDICGILPAQTSITIIQSDSAKNDTTMVSASHNGKALAVYDDDEDVSLDQLFGSTEAQEVAIVATVVGCSVPILIIFFICFFNYRARQAKYKAMAAAYAACGKMPEDFDKGSLKDNMMYSGIRQACLGVGLAIFLWILCNAQLACIGILVFFIGCGKILSAWFHKRQEGQQAQPHIDAEADQPHDKD